MRIKQFLFVALFVTSFGFSLCHNVSDDEEITSEQLVPILLGNYPAFFRMAINCGYHRAKLRGTLSEYTRRPIGHHHSKREMTLEQFQTQLDQICLELVKILNQPTALCNSNNQKRSATLDDESMVYLG